MRRGRPGLALVSTEERAPQRVAGLDLGAGGDPKARLWWRRYRRRVENFAPDALDGTSSHVMESILLVETHLWSLELSAIKYLGSIRSRSNLHHRDRGG